MEVTGNKKLKKRKRKELQVKHCSHLTRKARRVKLADKICNLRDVAANPPARWPLKRQIEYFDWAKAVIDGIRGTHQRLEALFDATYAPRPHTRRWKRHIKPAVRGPYYR
jgi:GTP diphosphokinase / guanosine-3',5'-bis(diphosphate) 3'-diphosphatase